MTTLVMNAFTPVNTFFRGFMNFCEVLGYSRAATHLAMLGYHKEAKECMMQVAKLKR